MGVPHDHLKRPVPEQLRYRTQIHTGHNQSTGKGTAVAMPDVPFGLRTFKCCRIAAADPCKVSRPWIDGNPRFLMWRNCKILPEFDNPPDRGLKFLAVKGSDDIAVRMSRGNDPAKDLYLISVKQIEALQIAVTLVSQMAVRSLP